MITTILALYIPTFLALYMLGFIAVLFFNLFQEQITFGLCMTRAAAWPYYVLTGKPEGARLPMD